MSGVRLSESKRAELFTALLLLIILLGASVGTASAVRSAVWQSMTSHSNVITRTYDIPITVPTPDTPVKIDTPDTPAEPVKIEKKRKVYTPPDPLPQKYQIKMKHITQFDNLVTGCEIVSTCMVLNYYGKDSVTPEDMLTHLRRGKLKVNKDGVLYGPTPDDMFIGDPHRLDGFGCFAPAICKVVHNYYYTDIEAIDTTGTPLSELCATYVANDIPVIIWVTDGMSPVGEGDRWRSVDSSGKMTKEEFVWPLNEHCVVLIGYDKSNYVICDPLDWSESTKYDKKLVEKRNKELYNMSVTIMPIEYEEK